MTMGGIFKNGRLIPVRRVVVYEADFSSDSDVTIDMTAAAFQRVPTPVAPAPVIAEAVSAAVMSAYSDQGNKVAVLATE